ncbi:MAG TPA: ankyrin repeat domain-containing protein [Steroidobacteraceae bacterium]|nr:ankyrin repeat domain-containing protein [Steroidobacteraceae bacterium]
MRKLLWLALLVPVLAIAANHDEANHQLFAALQAQDPETALYALSQGAEATAREPDGTTPLHYAAHYGDARLIAALLKGKADPNAANNFGAKPLAEAATNGNAGAIRLLLKAGAEVEAKNSEGQTALMVVARAGKVDAAKLLVKAGADVNAREGWAQQTALMWAAAEQQPEMIHLLLKSGAKVDARGAIREWARRVTSEPRPKGENRGGFTPLLYAAREGCIPCAKELLAGGADIDLADPDQTTPLVEALLNMHFDFAVFLIDHGADIDRWDLYGQTPLYVAIDMDTLPTGGRPDIPSTDFTTGVQVAAKLLARGANPNIPLKLRPPYRNYIFDRGGDQVLSTGATPLLLAAKTGDVEALKLLIQYKADLNLPNEQGVTPLLAAAGSGHGNNPTRGRYKTDDEAAECVRLLVEAGVDVNQTDRSRQTALHMAAQHAWVHTVQMLADKGADLEFADNRGMRPFDAAGGPGARGGGPDAAAQKETQDLLRKLILAKTGHAPQESRPAPMGPGGPGRPGAPGGFGGRGGGAGAPNPGQGAAGAPPTASR